MSTLRSPRALSASDIYSTFDCGEPSLNDWLKKRALRNETAGSARTFVSIDADSGEIAGYYCLSASSLLREDAPGAVARNMPDPIPVILIGRLAVDQRFKGHSLGASLLQHAILKGVEASRMIGARAFIVDALNEPAAAFYAKFGFAPMAADRERPMYLLLKDVAATLAQIEG